MSKSGPILIIEDDSDDKEIFENIVRELNYSNPIVWYDNTEDALDYLCRTSQSVFIIFCDINLPGKNGLEFKSEIDADSQLRKKSIPFIFYTTTSSQKSVNEAYTQMTVQGYFKKASDYGEIKNNIELIMNYWSACIHPNTQ